MLGKSLIVKEIDSKKKYNPFKSNLEIIRIVLMMPFIPMNRNSKKKQSILIISIN